MIAPIEVPAGPAAIVMLETFADILSRNVEKPITQPQQEPDAA
jgi:hypothetical protein